MRVLFDRSFVKCYRCGSVNGVLVELASQKLRTARASEEF